MTLTLADLPPPLLRVAALAFGLCWGSFCNVLIHRMPRQMSVMRPASHCPACGQPIRPWHNIPVLSWLGLRGKAACCGARISARYPLVELIVGVLSLAIVEAIVLPLPASTPALHVLAVYVVDLGLVVGLTAVAFIDLEHMIIPNSLSIGGTVLGIGTFSLRGMSIEQALLGAALGFILVWLPFGVIHARLRGRPGMGLGDAKLLMLAGAWFGWFGVLFVLGAGAIQGTVVTLAVTLVRGPPEVPAAVRREREQLRAELAELPPAERAEIEREIGVDPLAEEPEPGLRKARVAFGPFLVLSTLECLLLGPERIMHYLLAS